MNQGTVEPWNKQKMYPKDKNIAQRDRQHDYIILSMLLN